MSAAPDYSPGWAAEPPRDLAGLLVGAEAAVDRLASGADLASIADAETSAAMGRLTGLVARLNALRVAVAAEAHQRELFRHRGARNLVGWLRADARVADEAWQLARLATAAPELPNVTGLLEAGEVSLAQAATACWQIGQLPEVPRRPEEMDSPESSAAGAPGADDSLGAQGPPGGKDLPGAEDRWAGLWRVGDVHAAADELFSSVLPRLDCAQVRQLGAHLREAADAQERAGEEYREFARRGLRICRSLGGCGEITGRLHAEAAEQVIAAFEELGAKTGPEDARTKAQRWADVLTRLAAGATGSPAPPPADLPAEPADDQPCLAATGHGDHGGHSAHDGQPDRPAGQDAAVGPVPAPPPAAGDAGDAGADIGGPVPAGLQRLRLLVTVPLATLLGQPLAPGATILGPGTPLAARRPAGWPATLRSSAWSPARPAALAIRTRRRPASRRHRAPRRRRGPHRHLGPDR